MQQLAPEIGYDKAAKIAKVAYESGRTVREVAAEISGLDKRRLDALLECERPRRSRVVDRALGEAVRIEIRQDLALLSIYVSIKQNRGTG